MYRHAHDSLQPVVCPHVQLVLMIQGPSVNGNQVYISNLLKRAKKQVIPLPTTDGWWVCEPHRDQQDPRATSMPLFAE